MNHTFLYFLFSNFSEWVCRLSYNKCCLKSSLFPFSLKRISSPFPASFCTFGTRRCFPRAARGVDGFFILLSGLCPALKIRAPRAGDHPGAFIVYSWQAIKKTCFRKSFSLVTRAGIEPALPP